MRSIEIYLITDGKGAEAIEFYRQAFQAEVKQAVTFGEGWPECPLEFKDLIMNAQMYVGDIRIQLSDNNPMFPYLRGENMSAALICESVEEAQALYDALTVDAQNIQMPLQEVPWSPAYAGFIDKYGINWQINVEII